jgi:hypothetical protein
MILIDQRLTNLVQGYDLIRQSDHYLARKWRHRLLAAYARRRDAYDSARAQRRVRARRVLPWLAVGLIVTVLAILGGLLLSTASLSTVLILMGCAVGAAVGGAGLWQFLLEVPMRPAHPLHGRLRTRLFPSLLPRWRQGLVGRFPPGKPYEGVVGERRFVQALQRSKAQGYILYRLRQRHGDDVDAVVVGPSGVWVFEVKYWSGRIVWQDGQWYREKTYYAPGGRLVTEPREVSQPPDHQWQRMADDVIETLRRRDRQLLARIPSLARIRGGLAFTHDGASYEIAADCPFAWGKIGLWQQQLAKAPRLAGLHERDLLLVIDALLARHSEFGEQSEALSMEVYAKDLVQGVEARLATWTRDR